MVLIEEVGATNNKPKLDAECWLENLGDEGYSRSGLPEKGELDNSGRLDRSYKPSWQRGLCANGQGRSHYLDIGLVSFILLLLVPT